MNIYNNIREIAEQKKIQQKEIAKAMNVGINTVNNWFNGNTSMKAEQIPIIAKILRVSIDSIFKENFEKITKAEDPSAEYHRKCVQCEEKDRLILELNAELRETSKKLIDRLEQERSDDLNGEVQEAKVS